MQYPAPRNHEREIEPPSDDLPDDRPDDRHRDETTPDATAREKSGTDDYKYTDWASI